MNASYRRSALLLLFALILLGWWWLSRMRVSVAVIPETHTRQAQQVESRPSSLQALLAKHFPGINVLALERAAKRCEEDAHQATRARWETLGRSSDRDDRIAHALLANMFDDNAGESTRLLGELSAASPEDADLLWFHATRCQRKHGCDAHAAGERLVAAEPGNLANWLVVLSQAANNAGTTNDDAALDGLLARAAQSRYYAQRHVDAFLRTYQSLRDLPVPASCNTPDALAGRRLMQQMGVRGLEGSMQSGEMALTTAIAAMTTYMPSGGRIDLLCPSTESLPRARMQSCRSIAALMADGETLLDQALGLGMMVRLTEGLPEHEAAQWRERYRQHRWLMEQRDMAFELDMSTAYARMTEGEARTHQAELQRQGRWPPPADWLPRDEHARSLITGSPPPP